MKKQILRTPDGVRDIYNGECERKLVLETRLNDTLRSYGYHNIQTPTIEFFNIFGNDIGTTPSRDLYKFFDKEGNTLVLRPDFTPSIARAAASYYMEENMPVKLCYIGNTFTNSSDYRGHLKENTQCGAELIGDGTTAADAEILAMICDCLTSSGLRRFQISVGHAQFFSGLVKAAGIDEENEGILREYISNKNFLGVEDVVETLNLNDDLKALFLLLGKFDTTAEDLINAKAIAADYPEILKSLDELVNLHTYLQYFGIEKYVSYELGIISSFRYYTGIIFSGYTFGTGEPIVKGGRYDSLLSYFGKQAPAIGFAIVVDQLMAAISRQKVNISVKNNSALLVFTEDRAKAAVARAISLRAKGYSVEMLLKDPDKTRDTYAAYAVANHISKVEFMDSEVQ